MRVYFKEGKYKLIIDNLVNENISFVSGARIDSGYGLITNSEKPTNPALNWKIHLKGWELLKAESSNIIELLLRDLKNTIEIENEMKF